MDPVQQIREQLKKTLSLKNQPQIENQQQKKSFLPKEKLFFLYMTKNTMMRQEEKKIFFTTLSTIKEGDEEHQLETKNP